MGEGAPLSLGEEHFVFDDVDEVEGTEVLKERLEEGNRNPVHEDRVNESPRYEVVVPLVVDYQRNQRSVDEHRLRYIYGYPQLPV